MGRRRRNREDIEKSRIKCPDTGCDPKIQCVGAKLFRWRQKYGGMDTSEVRRLNDLKHENAELRKIMVEQALDTRMLKDIISKKMVSLAERRTMTDYLIDFYDVSERHACKVVVLPRSTYRESPSQATRIELTAEIVRLSYQYDQFGYRKIHVLFVNAGWRVDRETVRLIRKRDGLQVQKKQHKKRLLGQSTTVLQQAQYPNHAWRYDFVFDQSEDGRPLKHLTVVDEFTKEGLMIDVQRSITSSTVIHCLDYLFDLYGKLVCIKSDNGPEFVANTNP